MPQYGHSCMDDCIYCIQCAPESRRRCSVQVQSETTCHRCQSVVCHVGQWRKWHCQQATLTIVPSSCQRDICPPCLTCSPAVTEGRSLLPASPVQRHTHMLSILCVLGDTKTSKVRKRRELSPSNYKNITVMINYCIVKKMNTTIQIPNAVTSVLKYLQKSHHYFL